MRLAITIGDAAGIGPEVILKALASDPTLDAIVFGALSVLLAEDAALTQSCADYTSQAHRLVPVSAPDAPIAAGQIGVLDVSPGLDWSRLPRGEHDARCARLQLDAFTCAIEAARVGQVDAIVTAPWNKALLKLIGARPTGHTELLEEAFDAPEHVMMLAGPKLRVALVTTHAPLSRVSDLVTRERVIATILTTGRDLQRRFGVAHPTLAVCGLNPHAGEGGIMGDEELRTIAPAVAEARAQEPTWTITDPLPSDTLFAGIGAGRRACDAVICMYHDQGLIPLKLLHFGISANITLGLPIVRTSVDHGTAYDIAGSGVADAGSMRYALTIAREMVRASRPRG